jgi:hypothetical protein
MKGNVTSGILLLLGAALLITVGVSGKGLQILDILFGKTPPATATPQGTDNAPSNVQLLNYTNLGTPGAHVGIKGAAIV